MSAQLIAADAHAQTAPADQEITEVAEIVVTGTRIRRSDTSTAAPVVTVDREVLDERGYVQAGQALNQNTSVVPSTPLADGSGAQSGGGQQYPNLFGLGPGRTLTLVNGRRFVTTAQGMGDRVVDTNIIPVGLLSRVDVVQAGGAAVYGSDAIAGVINYVLRDDFDGMEFDAQYGESWRGDYPQSSLRFTAGRNLLDERANVAGSVEWSQSDSLLSYDRPISDLARLTTSNPADTGPDDGIPSLREIFNARFWPFNYNGVIYTTPAPSPALLLRIGGAPTQFSADGQSVVSYDPGVIHGVPFASGGEGWDYREIAALYSGVERFNTSLIGRYDLSDRVRLTGEFTFAHTEGQDPFGTQGGSNTVLNNAASGAGVLTFTRNNPFLTPQARAQLEAASPAFAAGAPLFLSKQWSDALPTREFIHSTDVWRGQVGLEGDFDYADRQFYWSLSYSRAQVEGEQSGWGVWTQRMQRAVNAVESGGQIVCAVNADADPSNDDPACVPINMFGNGTVTDAMRDYVSVPVGQTYENTQDNLLATLGGTLFELPAGPVDFSVAYEYRAEEAVFTPSEAAQQGLTGSGTRSVPTSGDYNTNEFSAEVLIPILGADVTLPFVRSLEIDGAYRVVDNSIAGKENVWGAGLRWGVVEGVTLRASRSRNFRAPTLNQLFAPSTTSLGSIGRNPCDADRIATGPNPAVRRTNCEALFAANPSWGPLAGFQDPGENFSNVMVTSGGNPSLRNELSDTTTYGVILQPGFVPGLTIVADRVEVELKDGLSPFAPEDFLATCFDSSEPSSACDTFTFNDQGHVATATSTTFNAGRVRYEGEVYNVNYVIRLDDWFQGGGYGRLELNAEITHTALLETSVTGFDYLRTDGTTTAPDWVSRYDVRYARGPLRLTYTASYLPEVKVNRFDTIESTPTPSIDANLRHSVSALYDFGDYTVRAGVTNLTDEEPSYPTRNYGDILGRQWFLGLNARF
jgi:iron complex outermembrane receptor protein